MPITMDGTPFSKSVVYRTTNENVLPPNSARYTPVSNPTGRPIKAANISSFRLPTMALAIPPPVSPTGLGSCVKKFQLSDVPPFQIRYPRIKNRIETTPSAAIPVRLSITKFSDFRQIMRGLLMQADLRRAQ